jgi:hypothetical protein
MNVATHEMGHVLGIGTLWHALGLVEGEGLPNPGYIGSAGKREYGCLTGVTETSVPVAGPEAGVNEEDQHWDEFTFAKELMTPVSSGSVQPLSRLTVGALEDLGYAVDITKAESYSLPGITPHCPA